MDRIFKNDRIMGGVALITLAIVAWVAYDNHKSKQLPSQEEKK